MIHALGTRISPSSKNEQESNIKREVRRPLLPNASSIPACDRSLRGVGTSKTLSPGVNHKWKSCAGASRRTKEQSNPNAVFQDLFFVFDNLK